MGCSPFIVKTVQSVRGIIKKQMERKSYHGYTRVKKMETLETALQTLTDEELKDSLNRHHLVVDEEVRPVY